MENYDRIEKYGNSTYYYLNDKLHRLDGPAAEYCDGSKEWYQNGLCHRINGPACEGCDYKAWLQNGLWHRIDGPAREWFNGYKEWWIEGEEINCNSQEEFERYIKLKLFW
jgi:hypothetical protein